MTRKIYLDDSYLYEFKSRVVEANKTADGFEIILESTAFYPESGGQLNDFGLLDGESVIDVQLNDKEEVVHLVKDFKSNIGTEISGTIDIDRRLDNMRKHTAQHILSQSFVEIGGAKTVSAHLGEVESTIELSIDSLENDVLLKVERLANKVVLENRPVASFWLNRDELKKYPIRKIPDREGKFRIIEVNKFDYTACGGTHCHFTGEIGLVKIIALEKIRGHLRVTFLTGRQALDDYNTKHDAVGKLSNRLTCHFTGVNDSVEKLLEQNILLRKEIIALNKKLLPQEIERLKKTAIDMGEFKVVIENFEDKDLKELKILASAICSSFDSVVVFAGRDKMQIYISNGLPINASKLAKEVMEKYGGKGGGSAAFAQIGSIPVGKTGEILDNIVKIIKEFSDMD